MVASLAPALALALAAIAAPATPPTEDQKIEALIGRVDQMTDAVFVRNGSSYDGHAAAKHLREKWRWKKGEVKTARDFIRLCASVSSQSGQPYLLRWKDGRTQKAADFFGAELDKLEGKTGPPPR